MLACYLLVFSQSCGLTADSLLALKERMVQLQDAQKGAEVTSEASERELELEAQLVEARSIIQEQVEDFQFTLKLDY